MMLEVSRWSRAAVIFLALVGADGGQPRANTPDDALSIGEASLVVPDVSGRIGEVTRTINVQDNVFADEVINTTERGATRIVFEDSTELTVGANSTVVLDQFVYDPNAGAGSLVVNLLKGVFEFNSGDMPSDAYRLNTPSATLAIRGTSFTTAMEPGDAPDTYNLSVFVEEGTVDITYVDENGDTQVVVVDEGEGVIIRNLPLREFAANQGTRAAVTVDYCSGAACDEGQFAAINALLAEQLFGVIILAVEPEAGGDSALGRSTLPANTGGGGGGGGLDSVSDF